MPFHRFALATRQHLIVLVPFALASAPAWAQRTSHAPGRLPWTLVALLCLALLGALVMLWRARLQSANAQREIAARTRAERDQQNHFRIIVELNPAPISVSTLGEGRLLMVNRAWEKLFGWSAPEALGRTTQELGIWARPGDRPHVVESLQQHGEIFRQMTHCMHREGRPLDVCFNAVRIDYEGRPCMVTAILDMSGETAVREELERLNQALEARIAERTHGLETANRTLEASLAALRQAQDELIHTGAMASLGQSVAGISHELNGPIGNARLSASTIADQVRDFQDQYAERPPEREALTIFLADLAHVSRVLNQTLERAAGLIASFKLIAADQSTERRREFLLDTVVKDLLNTLRPGFKRKPCELKVQLDQGLHMDSYPGPLGQVISNLVQHALDHSLAARERGAIEIRALGLGGDEVEIVIEDNGRSIAAEDLPTLFEPFPSTLAKPATGLGLALAHRLVTGVLGGSLEVHAEPERGNLFRLRLPRVAPQSTGSPRAA